MIGLICWPLTNTGTLFNINAVLQDSISFSITYLVNRHLQVWPLPMHRNGFGKAMRWLQKLLLLIVVGGVFQILTCCFALISRKGGCLIIINNICGLIRITFRIIMCLG